MTSAISGLNFSSFGDIKVSSYNTKNPGTTVKYTTQSYDDIIDFNDISVYNDIPDTMIYPEFYQKYSDGAVYHQKAVTRIIRELLLSVNDFDGVSAWAKYVMIALSVVTDISTNIFGSAEISGKGYTSSVIWKQIVSDVLKTPDKVKVGQVNISPKSFFTKRFAANSFKKYVSKDKVLSNIFEDIKIESPDKIIEYLELLNINPKLLKMEFGKFVFNTFGAEAAVNVGIALISELVPCIVEAIETKNLGAFAKYKYGSALYTGVATAAWSVGGKLLFSWLPAPAKKVVTKVWNVAGTTLIKFMCDQYSSEAARAAATGGVVVGVATGIVLVCCISSIPVVGWAFGAAVLVGAAVGSLLVLIIDKLGVFT